MGIWEEDVERRRGSECRMSGQEGLEGAELGREDMPGRTENVNTNQSGGERDKILCVKEKEKGNWEQK